MSEPQANKAVAVTGATGLLGKALCMHLAAEGWQVRAMARRGDDDLAALENVNQYHCDLPHEIDPAATQGAHALIHCAYMTRFTTMEEARAVNEQGAAELLSLARAAGARFIFVSSNSARAEAHSYYARSKYAVEQTLDLGRDAVVRPGLILSDQGGLALRIAKLVKRLPLLPSFGSSGRKIQPVHIDDLCQAFSRMLEQDYHGLVTIADEDGVTMGELLKLMARALGVKRVIIPLPAAPFVVLLRMLEALGIKLPVSSENLKGLIGLKQQESTSRAGDLGLRIRGAAQSFGDLAEALRGQKN